MKLSTLAAALPLPLLSPAQIISPSADPPTKIKCRNVVFNIDARAQNKVLINPPEDLYSNISHIAEFLYQDNGRVERGDTGPYDISAQYCTPAKQHPRYKNPLLLFVHGNTYDSSYWSGMGSPEGGDWVKYANEQGYYTLAIDRLGSGRSSKPDAVKDVQAPLQAAIIERLLTTHILPSFTPTTFVGHSYGSILGTQLAFLHPSLLSSYILTGIAAEAKGDNPLPRQLAAVHMPASLYDPVRFPAAVYGPGYLVPAVKEQRADTFYSDPKADYSATLFDHDYVVKDIMTLGEAASQDKYVASAYTGRVFVTTGRADSVFCGNGTWTEADCERTQPNQLQDFASTYFPRARAGSYLQQGVGHCALQHYGWQSAVQKAHEWLENDMRLPRPGQN